MRWRRLGRSVKRRVTWSVQDITQRVRPIKVETWMVRRSDGAIYAGPYRWQGQTFTRAPHLQYGYGTESAARRAWEELGGDKYHRGKIEVVKIK